MTTLHVDYLLSAYFVPGTGNRNETSRADICGKGILSEGTVSKGDDGPVVWRRACCQETRRPV